jgi:hypothetical protein
VSKAKSKELLSGQEAGTFIIRFSQTNPGHLVVTYVSEDGRIKDIMMQVRCHNILGGKKFRKDISLGEACLVAHAPAR